MGYSKDQLELEYAIIGSGPGSIGVVMGLAKKYPKCRIGVFERGDHQRDHPNTYLVDGIGKVIAHDDIVLEKDTVKQTCANNKKVPLLDPNIVGGGSSINGMVFTPGSYKDYTNKEWGGYTWDRISKATEKADRKIKSQTAYKSSHHEHVMCKSKEMDFRQLTIRDIDCGDLNGFGYQRLNVTKATKKCPVGKRKSMFEMLMEPLLMECRNVRLYSEHKVHYINWKKDCYGNYERPLKATSVCVENMRTRWKGNVIVHKEVINGAGVFGSVKTLARSGYGPKKNLEANCVKCVYDNPHLGQHLNDQAQIRYVGYVSKETKLPCDKDPNKPSGVFWYTYAATIIGFLSAIFISLLYTNFISFSIKSHVLCLLLSGVVEGIIWSWYGIFNWWFLCGYVVGLVGTIVFIYLNHIVFEYSWWFSASFWLGYLIGFVYSRIVYRKFHPNIANQSLSSQGWTFGKRNIQFYFSSGWAFSDFVGKALIHFQYYKTLQNIFRTMVQFIVDALQFRYLFIKNTFLVLITTRIAKSLGSYTWNKHGKWDIDVGYLKCEEDIQDLICGMKIANELTKDLYSFRIMPFFKLRTDEDYRNYVLNNVATSYHLTGTCRMSTYPEDGVVSNRGCKVWGTSNVRVVGSPVFPNGYQGEQNGNSTSNSVTCFAIGYITAIHYM